MWDSTGLFRSLRSSEIECKDCESFPICAGSCRLVAYLHGGINSRLPDCSNVCIYKREFEVKA
ncbi:MAG: hypothetical protein ACOX84_05480 [Methanothrix sp.]|uniref:hypothetical protein n=1 Tax=Methanothrix sp. TaxID=90426 RepID=UPI00345E587F